MPLFLTLVAVAIAVALFVWTRKPAVESPRADIDVGTLRSLDDAIDTLKLPSEQQAIVLLDDPSTLSIDSVRESIEKLWDRGVDDRIGGSRARRAIFVRGGTFSYELIQPVHTTDQFRAAIAHSAGEDALTPEDAAGHTAAVLVEADLDESHRADPLSVSFALSQAVYGLMKANAGAIGVVWAGQSHVLPRRTVLKAFGKELNSFPVEHWVTRKTWSDSSGVRGYTRGLDRFGAVDFEALDADEDPELLRERLRSLIVYSIFNCKRIKNGDTTGFDEIERIRLAKQPAELGARGWVFQMRYIKGTRGPGR